MITSSGKVKKKQTETEKLDKLFYHNHRTKENVYKEVILGKQPWFEKGNPDSYRSQLLKRGLTQREATSVYKSVLSQLSANRENLKAYRENQAIKLHKAIKELVKVKQETPRNKGKVRSKNELVQRLSTSIKRINQELEQEYPNLYFTRKDTKLALQYPEEYGYDNHAEAYQAFIRERDNGYFLEGDRQSLHGNYSAKILLDPEQSKGGTLFLKNPYGEDIQLECKGFSSKQGRFEILAAQERYSIQHGGKHNKKLNVCHSPVTVRIHWSKKYQAYYVHVSVERDPWVIQRAKQLRLEQTMKHEQQSPSIINQDKQVKNNTKSKQVITDYEHVLGIDLNPSHIAYCLVTRDGNPLPKHSGRIDLKANGSKGQRKASLGNSVKQLLLLHKELETLYGPILLVTEKLNFKQGKKTNIPAVNHTLNTFAYSQFKKILSHRLLENGIEYVEVNPSYTSKIGQLNYANPYGISVDIAASIVIARKGLSFNHRLRPIIRAGFAELSSKTIKGSPKGKTKHVNKYTQICDYIGSRALTWMSGLLNRVQVLNTSNFSNDPSPRP